MYFVWSSRAICVEKLDVIMKPHLPLKHYVNQIFNFPQTPPSPAHLNTVISTSSISSKNIKHATQIHTQIITNNYSCFPFLVSNLLNLYAKCGYINQTLVMFHKTRNDYKNVVTYTSLITQLSHSSKFIDALQVFSQMRRSGIFPNQFTFSAVLPVCAGMEIAVHGEQVHCLICKHGYDCDVFVGSALVNMYAKCDVMESAEMMFDEMPERNLVTWNSMIVGFLRNKVYNRAIWFFEDVMEDESVCPDQVSFSGCLSACANVGDLKIGRQVHGVILKQGVTSLTYVKNALMDMYSKCGSFEDLSKLFQTKTLEDRDVVTWNVMIMGSVKSDKFEEACNYFWVMRSKGVSPDEVSFSTALHAVANMAALDQGSLIHDQIIKTGYVTNTCVASSLITMYAKCGCLSDSSRVFDEIKNRNVVCWTAMIAAFQQDGCANRVIELFEDMLRHGLKPDYITMVCVLSACSHAGHVEKGFIFFDSMAKLHDITPGREHYACMVDILGRAGRLDQAKRFIESMPMKPDASVYGALLGASSKYGNLEMGQEIAEILFKIEPNNHGNYVLLSNMYSRAGRLVEANELRKTMRDNGVIKEPGSSWIDVKNKTFVFTAHDRSHTRTDEIYDILRNLEEMCKKKGYVAETQYASNSADHSKEQSLWYHSERLALAFGLLVLPVGAPIRIKKNLRTCGDCHTVMKFASKIFTREIIVRDINRFHRFVDGSCSCGDYW